MSVYIAAQDPTPSVICPPGGVLRFIGYAGPSFAPSQLGDSCQYQPPEKVSSACCSLKAALHVGHR
jgi:hypothetical protein